MKILTQVLVLSGIVGLVACGDKSGDGSGSGAGVAAPATVVGTWVADTAAFGSNAKAAITKMATEKGVPAEQVSLMVSMMDAMMSKMKMTCGFEAGGKCWSESTDGTEPMKREDGTWTQSGDIITVTGTEDPVPPLTFKNGELYAEMDIPEAGKVRMPFKRK